MTIQLGNTEFLGVFAPNSMELGGSANYAEHALIQGRPMLQRLGSKLNTLSMGITLHRQFEIPEDRIAEFEAYMESGEILPLITGAGDVVGDFVLTDISKSMVALAADGSIIECAVSLTLRQYSTPDRAARVRNAARSRAFALAENNPVPSPAGSTSMVEAEASENVTAMAASATAMSDSTTKAAAIPAQEEFHRAKIKVSLRDMMAKAMSARAICNGFSGDLFTNTRDLDTDLINLLGQAESLMTIVLQGGEVATIRNLVDAILAKVADAKASAAFLNAFTANRR